MKTSFDFAEQDTKTTIIEIVLKDETIINVNQSDILDFIESEQLNLSIEYLGNNSPRNDGDPCYDMEAEVTTDVLEYFNDNFNDVCEQYFNQILNK